MERIEIPGVDAEKREALSEQLRVHRNMTVRWAIAFATSGKTFYKGTVPAHVKARRRAKNRVARASRKSNR